MAERRWNMKKRTIFDAFRQFWNTKPWVTAHLDYQTAGRPQSRIIFNEYYVFRCTNLFLLIVICDRVRCSIIIAITISTGFGIRVCLTKINFAIEWKSLNTFAFWLRICRCNEADIGAQMQQPTICRDERQHWQVSETGSWVTFRAHATHKHHSQLNLSLRLDEIFYNSVMVIAHWKWCTLGCWIILLSRLNKLWTKRKLKVTYRI